MLDSRHSPVTPADTEGAYRVYGLRLLPAAIALAAAALHFDYNPGEVQLGHRVASFRGGTKQVYSGSSLADLSTVRAALVAALHPPSDQIRLYLVERAPALTTADAGAITDTEIEAAIHATATANKDYTVLGQVAFARSGTAYTLTIDHLSRTFYVDADRKDTSTAAYAWSPTGGNADGRFVPGPVLEVVANATEWANVDLVTDYPINFHGRIRRLVRITEVVIAGAGAVVNVNAEIGTTDVTGLTVASTLADAKGTVATDEPTTYAIVKPGDVVSLEMSGATAGSSGRARFRLEFEQLVG